MERKIGKIFNYDDNVLQVIERNNDCGACYFYGSKYCNYSKRKVVNSVIGKCSKYTRDDNKSVMFVKFKLVDMCENKEEKRNVELTLEKAQEWYKKGGELKEVALQAFNESELKDNRSHTWEEFCQTHNQPGEKQYWYINLDSEIGDITGSYDITAKDDRNLYPTKKYAEAARALAQLLMLRQEWVGDWEPKWFNNNDIVKYVIEVSANKITFMDSMIKPRTLSFPTREMVVEFINDFGDLLEIAKPLL